MNSTCKFELERDLFKQTELYATFDCYVATKRIVINGSRSYPISSKVPALHMRLMAKEGVEIQDVSTGPQGKGKINITMGTSPQQYYSNTFQAITPFARVLEQCESRSCFYVRKSITKIYLHCGTREWLLSKYRRLFCMRLYVWSYIFTSQMRFAKDHTKIRQDSAPQKSVRIAQSNAAREDLGLGVRRFNFIFCKYKPRRTSYLRLL